MAQGSCVSCGKAVYRGPKSRPEITCHDCRREARRRVCVRCGVEFMAHTSTEARPYCGVRCSAPAALEAARKALSSRPRVMRDCEVCGKPFPPKSSHGLVQRTCSRECGKWINARARGKFTEWRSILPTCEKCGAVTYRGKLSHYCRECVDVAKRESWARDAAKRKKPPRPILTIECQLCGCGLTTAYPETKWCRRCRRSVRKGDHRHRARRYGVAYEPINPAEIYERDNWTCHICSEEIRRVPGNEVDIDGWSLDHVIPMSHGGPHLKWNVAASHWGCNVLKGDDFLLLAG